MYDEIYPWSTRYITCPNCGEEIAVNEVRIQDFDWYCPECGEYINRFEVETDIL